MKIALIIRNFIGALDIVCLIVSNSLNYVKMENMKKQYPIEFNYHRYTPLYYSFKSKTLYVETFFFLLGEPSFISFIADYCKSIKKIEILMMTTLEGKLADQFSKDKTLDIPVMEEYLQKFLRT